jgi:hypothetical protein
MSVSLPLVVGLYGIAAVVLGVGLLTAATGKMPGFLQASTQSPTVAKTRLSGLELVLMGLFMLLTALAYGGDGQSTRVLLVLMTWVGFSCAVLLLRMISRSLDKQRARA